MLKNNSNSNTDKYAQPLLLTQARVALILDEFYKSLGCANNKYRDSGFETDNADRYLDGIGALSSTDKNDYLFRFQSFLILSCALKLHSVGLGSINLDNANILFEVRQFWIEFFKGESKLPENVVESNLLNLEIDVSLCDLEFSKEQIEYLFFKSNSVVIKGNSTIFNAKNHQERCNFAVDEIEKYQIESINSVLSQIVSDSEQVEISANYQDSDVKFVIDMNMDHFLKIRKFPAFGNSFNLPAFTVKSPIS